MPNLRSVTGRFGRFGGRFVSEALWAPLQQISDEFERALADTEFVNQCERWFDNRIGRPTPVSHLSALSEHLGGAQIWAKREDLCQGGAFCINTALVQALLAKRLGKSWLVGETATGDFGIALGAIANALGLQARVFMGREDSENEVLNLSRMKDLGVVVEVVDSHSRGRKAACSEALRFWATHSEHALYCASSLATPDPYPRLLTFSLSIIGAEANVQMSRRSCVPEYVVAPVGSGSFAAGLFSEFVEQRHVQLVGVQADGDGQQGRSSASLVWGTPGVFQGTLSFLLQDDDGQILIPHSVAGGLSMPIVGPQHARWAEEGRVHYVAIRDREAREAARLSARTEGLSVCLESAHGLAYVMKLAPTLSPEQHILVGISGSGLRDIGRFGSETTAEDES